MALKIGQAARSIPGLLRDPFGLPNVIDLYDGLADFRYLTCERVDRAAMRELPEDSVGRRHLAFMDHHGYVEDDYLKASRSSTGAFENHWTMLRFARIHDDHHTVLGIPVSVDDEAALQVFNTVNFGEPSGWAALPFLVLRHGSPLRMAHRIAVCAPAGLRLPEMFTFPFERRSGTPLRDLRRELEVPEDGLMGDSPA